MESTYVYSYSFCSEIETLNQALVSICSALKEATIIRGKCAPGSLIPAVKYDATELFSMSDSIDQKPFYGRCTGLHVSVPIIISIFDSQMINQHYH